MGSSTTPAVVIAFLLLAGACGGGYSAPSRPSAPPPTPTPAPIPTPPIDDFALVGSEPSPGGVIQTGVLPNGVTTAFTLTLSVASAADRMASLHVFLEGSSNGVCLEDMAPDGRPSAPDVELKAGIPVTVTIERWRVTSVCAYPNSVTTLTARLMPSPDILATPIYEEHFAIHYTVTQ